jgi:hypothetical protein
MSSMKDGIHHIAQTSVKATAIITEGMISAGVDPREAHKYAAPVAAQVMAGQVEDIFGDANAAQFTERLRELGSEYARWNQAQPARQFVCYEDKEE